MHRCHHPRRPLTSDAHYLNTESFNGFLTRQRFYESRLARIKYLHPAGRKMDAGERRRRVCMVLFVYSVVWNTKTSASKMFTPSKMHRQTSRTVFPPESQNKPERDEIFQLERHVCVFRVHEKLRFASGARKQSTLTCGNKILHRESLTLRGFEAAVR